jgi:hypothetical protein
VIACLRAARFLVPGGGGIHVELRRHHDLRSAGTGDRAVSFVVAKRMTAYPRTMTLKKFGTLPEARAYWMKQVTIIEDQGFERRDPRIIGFHEED